MSWLLAGVSGLTLGMSIHAGRVESWALFVLITVSTGFSGALVVEIIRSLANKFSSSFYKIGGRSVIIGRLIVTLSIIVLLSITYGAFFSPQIMSFILSTLVSGISAVWFFPIVWPSLAILAHLKADLASSFAYTSMSLLFVLALFWIALKLRAKYWVSSPASIRLTHREYAPRRGFLRVLGFTSAEAALIRKDFKSFTRRTEAVLTVAGPTLMIAMLYTLTGMFIETPESILIIPVYFSIYLSLTSIGQEGDGVLNLYYLPISEKEIMRGKFGYAFLPSFVVLLLTMVLSALFVQPSIRWLASYLVVGTCLMVEAGLWGIAVGSKHADFTTVPRSRFISPNGAAIGFFGFFAIAIVTLLPLLFYKGFEFLEEIVPFAYRAAWTLPFWLLASATISIILSIVLLRYARRQISKLRREYRF